MRPNSINKSNTKKIWITPQLIIHGNIEKITAEVPIPGKKYGAGDAASMKVRHSTHS